MPDPPIYTHFPAPEPAHIDMSDAGFAVYIQLERRSAVTPGTDLGSARAKVGFTV